MINEITFKITLFVLFCIFVSIRVYFSKKYLDSDEELLNTYPIIVKIMAFLSSVSILGFTLVYIFSDFLNSFQMNLPELIRIIGLIGYLLVDLGMWWVLHELGINFSQVSEKRSIIITGPYKYIRHPMYTIFIGWGLATLLITSNWLCILGVLFMVVLILLRTPIEEQTLLSEFGLEYRQYMKKTGKFLPLIRKKK